MEWNYQCEMLEFTKTRPLPHITIGAALRQNPCEPAGRNTLLIAVSSDAAETLPLLGNRSLFLPRFEVILLFWGFSFMWFFLLFRFFLIVA